MKALEILNTLISSENDDVFANKNYYEKLTFIAQAIEELEDLQNRSCDNCKFIYEDNLYRCNMKVSENFENDYVNKDFCCNKWEAKDE